MPQTEPLITDRELKSLIQAAKNSKDGLPFAFGVGKDRSRHVLVLHRKRSAEKLFKDVTQAGFEMDKCTHGVLQINGNVMKFQCGTDPVTKMPAKVRELLRSKELTFKPQIWDPDKKSVEDDELDVGSSGQSDKVGSLDDSAKAWHAKEEAAADAVAECWRAVQRADEKLREELKGDLNKIMAVLEFAQLKADIEEYAIAFQSLEQLDVLIKAFAIKAPSDKVGSLDDGAKAWHAKEETAVEAVAECVRAEQRAKEERQDEKLQKELKADLKKIMAVLDFAQSKADIAEYAIAFKSLEQLDVLIKAFAKKTPLDANKIDLELGASARPGLPTLPGDVTTMNVGKQLGSGSFGTIHAVDTKSTATPLVIKVPKRGAEKELKDEVDAYDQIGEHNNIVKCYGMQTVGGQKGLVMESLDGGDLTDTFKKLDALRDSKQLSEEDYWGTVQHLMCGTLAGLAHLEERGLTHNDISPMNVMLDTRTMQPKLIDLGLMAPVGAAVQKGHEDYRAPEKFVAPEGTGHASNEQDSYSVGQMAYGRGERREPKQPNSNVTEPAKFHAGADLSKLPRFQVIGTMMEKVAPDYLKKNDKGEYVAQAMKPEKPGKDAAAPGNYAEGYESDYVSFLNLMLHPDPKKRLTPSQALEHPFIKDSMLDESAAKSVLSRVTSSPKAKADALGRVAAQKAQLDAEQVLLDAEKEKWEQAIKSAPGLADKALKGTESGRSALAKAKPGAPILTDKTQTELARLRKDLEDAQSEIGRRRATTDDVIPAFAKHVDEMSKRAEPSEKKQLEKDKRALVRLAKLSRGLTAAHGTVSKAIRPLALFLARIDELSNQGLFHKDSSDKFDAAKVRKEAPKAISRWEISLEDADKAHAAAEMLIQKTSGPIEQARKADKDADKKLLGALGSASVKLFDRELALYGLDLEMADMRARIDKLARAGTGEARGLFQGAAKTAEEDGRLLLAATALQKRADSAKKQCKALRNRINQLLAEPQLAEA